MISYICRCPAPFHKTTLQKKKIVLKHKIIYEFLYAFITLFPNTPLINIVNIP